jgi:uncharacterized protein (DUF885 family)
VQCQGVIDANPFLLPTKKYPASISAEDQKRLTQQITDAINTDVIPAYKSFAAFISKELRPSGTHRAWNHISSRRSEALPK